MTETEKGYIEAWRRVCKVYRSEVADGSDPCQNGAVAAAVEENMIMFGDPNVGIPQGVVNRNPP